MEEEWKIFTGDYEVSNFGNCRRKGKPVMGWISRGYIAFGFWDCGKRRNYKSHVCVAKLFIGERPDGLVIDHIDRNKLNNHVSNLRYITNTENWRNCDKYRADILTDDTVERKRIINKESKIRNRKIKDSGRSPNGSGYITQAPSGNWRVRISLNKCKSSKTFKTREEAEKYRESIINPPQI